MLQVKLNATRCWKFVLAVIARFQGDHCTRHASALSFSTLLAFAPMVAIIFSMLSMFAATASLGEGMQDFIYRYLVPTAGDEVRQYLEQFASQVSALTAIGLLTFLLTALLLLFNIEESFNDIWRIKKGRTIAQRLTVYWAMVTLGPILMGASLSLSTYMLSTQIIQGSEWEAQTRSLGLRLLPFLIEVLAFLLLYSTMPNKRASWRAVAWGALVAALLFELSKRLFSLFILNFNNYEVIYGALATIPIFLIWIYLSWLVTLFGAEIIASLDEEPQLLDEEPEPLNEEPQPKEGLSLLKKGSERLLKVFQR
ncbi:MAG: YihY family inner membrane protein [Proteobacteria bacterium]|jgi:membrane protein|nr:YihY family inner membrane protein [Pseudomonadota bacterium]